MIAKEKDPDSYDDDLLVEIDKNAEDYHLRPKIGHESVSMTTIPNKWLSKEEFDECLTDIIYWDCPGFEDTKGPFQDIANAFYVKRLFENS